MVNLELSTGELDLLKQTLSGSLAQLEVELAHTDHREFKLLLKQRKALLEAVLAKVARCQGASG